MLPLYSTTCVLHFLYTYLVDYITFGDVQTNFSDLKNITINMEDVNYVLNGDNFQTEKYMDIMKSVYSFIPKLILFKELETSH